MYVIVNGRQTGKTYALVQWVKMPDTMSITGRVSP